MALTKISASVIAANAIVAAGVAENSISTSEIATDGVGTLQISDGAVTSGKLDSNIDIAGTLDVTGVLTADSNVVIAGNLTVNGATVTNSSTNTTIADALIELGTGTTGSPANDAGIVIERGDSDNAFIGWDESADTFILGTGSFTGASTGNLTISTAPLSVGTLTASGITFPTSDGSSGQVLKTDGSGTLTFDAQTAVVDNFTATGDGSTTDFDTGINPGDEVNTWVFIDGVYQQKGEYSYSGSTISFSTAPDSGATIDVTTGTVGGFASADSVLGVYETTTTNTDTYTTGISVSNENNTWVFVGGVYQPKDSYTFSSGTLTFDANTPTGQKLSVTATKSLSAGSVETNSITANAVTSAKIASNSILSRHIANNSIVGADISATTQITASTFTGALTGDVTGNVVGNLTGTIQTAAQTNITSLGTLTGLTTSGDINFGDNDKAIFGAGSDLQIYHDGSDSYLNESGTGNLYLQGTNHVYLTNSDGSKTYFAGNSPSGWVKLYHDNIVKLETTSTGIDVTGTATMDGLTVDTGTTNGAEVSIISTNTANSGANNPTLKLYRSGVLSGGFGQGGSLEFAGQNASGTEKTYATISGDIFDTTASSEDGYLTFKTMQAGTLTAAMEIDQQGFVGIGTASPSGELHILSTTSDTDLWVETTSAGGDARLNLYANSTGDSQIRFGDGDDANVGALTYDHSENAMVFRVNDAEKLRILSTGGITFNGDTATANALDDYEEGTWRPTIAGQTSAGTYTYGENAGVYTKIGNQVTCTFYIVDITVVSAGSGNLIIDNFPFTAANVTAGTIMDYYWGSCTLESFDVHASTVNIAVGMDAGRTLCLFWETLDSTSNSLTQVTDLNVSGAADIWGQVTYRTT